jgi:hypothetical protein
MQCIDAYTKRDPNISYWEGKIYPREYINSVRVYTQLSEYHPDATDTLKIAARAHNIGGWQIERDLYPLTRAGYKLWQQKLLQFSANVTTSILNSLDFDEAFIERTGEIILKTQIKSDLETQILEDVIGHVFLMYYAQDVAQKNTSEKMATIVKKTLNKMTPHRVSTVSTLGLPENIATFLNKILVS